MSEAEATLTVQAGQISTKVSRDGVISSINQTAEAVKISAGKINLSGYVTASKLSSELASLQTAFANTVSTVNLHATNVTTQNLTIGSDKVEKTFMEVVTGVHYSRETISVAAAGGGFASVVRSLNVWADTEKIWYFT